MGNPGWPSLTCNKAEVFRAMNWSETDSEHVQWFLNMKHGGQRAWEQIYNSLSPQERMADRSSRPSSKLGRAQYDQAAADALLSNVSRNEKHILQASTPLLAYMLYHGRREYNRTNRAKEQTWADRQALLSSALLSSSTAKPPSRRFRPPSASATQILAPRSRPTRSGFDQVYSPQPERLAELSQIEDYANDLACACTRASTSDTVTMDCTAAGEPMFGGLNPNTRPAALRNEGGWSDLRPPALATMNSSSKRSLANYSVICWHCRSPNVVDSLAIMGKPVGSKLSKETISQRLTLS